MIWQDILETMNSFNADLSIPVPSEHHSSPISHPEIQDDSGTISATSEAQSKAVVASPLLAPLQPKGTKSSPSQMRTGRWTSSWLTASLPPFLS